MDDIGDVLDDTWDIHYDTTVDNVVLLYKLVKVNDKSSFWIPTPSAALSHVAHFIGHFGDFEFINVLNSVF